MTFAQVLATIPGWRERLAGIGAATVTMLGIIAGVGYLALPEGVGIESLLSLLVIAAIVVLLLMGLLGLGGWAIDRIIGRHSPMTGLIAQAVLGGLLAGNGLVIIGGLIPGGGAGAAALLGFLGAVAALVMAWVARIVAPNRWLGWAVAGPVAVVGTVVVAATVT